MLHISNRHVVLALSSLLVVGCKTAGTSSSLDTLPLFAAEDSITADEIQAHVDFLASDELGGRYARGPEAERAAEYIAAQFASYGLEPMGDDGTWFQSIGGDFSPNVVALRRGSAAGCVVVTAHYDHLQRAEEGDDRIFNGADDNASGTAAVLEIAQAIGAQKAAPYRSIVFVAFTAEELGLRGSRYFVNERPEPIRELGDLGEIVGNINLDMVSRGEENLIFCEPGDGAERLVEVAEDANAEIGLDIRFGEHREWLSQSDQHAFLQRGIPAIYFGVEDHPDYHHVTDHADRILPGLAARVARLVLLMAQAL